MPILCTRISVWYLPNRELQTWFLYSKWSLKEIIYEHASTDKINDKINVDAQ